MDRAGNTLSQFSVQPVITDLSALTYDPCSKTIWVSNDSSNIVAEFDARTGAPTGNSFMPQGSVDGDGITYNPVTRTFLMGEDTGDQILEVDRQGTLLGIYATAPISPEGLALDTITGTVFVGNGLVTPRAVFEVANIVQAAPAGAVTDYGTACGGGNAALSHWVRDDSASCAGFSIGYQSAAAPGGNVLFNIGALRQNVPLSFLGSNCTVYAFGDYGSVLFTSNANGRVGLDIAVPPGASGFAIRFWFADVDVTSPGIVQGASQGIELVIQ